MSERTGGCLCGSVRFNARIEAGIQACHCIQCQRWTGGGPLLTVPVQDAKFDDESTLRAYRASEWGERLFCANCGSTVMWRMQGKPASSVAVGLLDDQTGLSVVEEIFTDHRPDWLTPWPGAAQSTEAEETAKLNTYLEGEAK